MVWLKRSQGACPSVEVDGKLRQPVFFVNQGKGRSRPMTAIELSKEAKDAMAEAGVPGNFTAHSIRSAASSAARDYGASVAAILTQGRWAKGGLWQDYYYRSIERKGAPIPKRSLQEQIRGGL